MHRRTRFGQSDGSAHSQDLSTHDCCTNRLGVDVLVDEWAAMAPESVPICPHGPMMLFRRFVSGQEPKRFFACSACRDRKDCDFYERVDGQRVRMSHKQRLFRGLSSANAA
jgi:hypothetical protein